MYDKTRKTKEQLIKEGIERYGDLVSYEKVVYVNNKTPVIFTCRKHGDFEQRPDNFLHCMGCKECKKEKSIKPSQERFENFKKKANKKFNNKFKYIGTYVNGDTPMDIECPVHGIINIKPLSHLISKYGCPECAKELAPKAPGVVMTKEEFIERAKQVHGDRFDYSKVDYTNKDTDVTIVCPVHGDFQQTPSNHLRGFGCKKCSGNYQYTTEEWVKMAKEKHPEENLSFENTVYTNNYTEVRIDCSKHGEFWALPNDFLKSQGCPRCFYERFAAERSLPFEEFVERANKVHKNKYTYNKETYKSLNDITTINCPIHGPFPQKGSNHLYGQGCPECAPKSGMEEDIAYLLELHGIDYVPQKSFDWFNRKRLDFYLTDYNIAIECQGIQHFKPTRFHNSQDKEQVYLDNVENDKYKREACLKHGIPIIYYTDVELDEYPYNVIKTEEGLLEEIYKHKKIENGTR